MRWKELNGMGREQLRQKMENRGISASDIKSTLNAIFYEESNRNRRRSRGSDPDEEAAIKYLQRIGILGSNLRTGWLADPIINPKESLRLRQRLVDFFRNEAGSARLDKVAPGVSSQIVSLIHRCSIAIWDNDLFRIAGELEEDERVATQEDTSKWWDGSLLHGWIFYPAHPWEMQVEPPSGEGRELLEDSYLLADMVIPIRFLEDKSFGWLFVRFIGGLKPAVGERPARESIRGLIGAVATNECFQSAYQLQTLKRHRFMLSPVAATKKALFPMGTRGIGNSAGRQSRTPDVVTVTLRPEAEWHGKAPKLPELPEPTGEITTEPEKIDWQYRWEVRGHWRRQWYPSRKTHETIWVEGYTKGPDEKPMKTDFAVAMVVR